MYPMAMWIQVALDTLAAVADAATILAAGWAFYVYWRNRDKVSAAINALRQYGTRTTLAELTSKLERLAKLRDRQLKDRERILGLLGDILGQIEGLPRLRQVFETEHRAITALRSQKEELSVFELRRLISRLTQTLKSQDIEIGHEE